MKLEDKRLQFAIVPMTIEIVSFPTKDGGSFHSCVNVYQRVSAAMMGISWDCDGK